MKLTDRMRKKYEPRSVKRMTSRTYGLRPAGAKDVLKLCAAVDALETLVRDQQHRMNLDAQNETERRLFFIGIE